MGTTTRWAVPYPERYDRPEGWLQLEALAEYLDDNLGHGLEVADATARTALGTAIGSGGRGLIVLQVDTSQPYMWLGASWLALGGAGGGGAVGSRGRYYQTGTAQQIPNSVDTIVRFDSDGYTTPDILKVSEGAGHVFAFQRAGIVTGSATLRYADADPVGVRHAHVVLGDNVDYLASGGGGDPGQPLNISMSFGPVAVAEDDELSVRCFQGTGSPRDLEPNAGKWVHLEIELR